MRAADPDGSGTVDQLEFIDAIDLMLRRADGPLGIQVRFGHPGNLGDGWAAI